MCDGAKISVVTHKCDVMLCGAVEVCMSAITRGPARVCDERLGMSGGKSLVWGDETRRVQACIMLKLPDE